MTRFFLALASVAAFFVIIMLLSARLNFISSLPSFFLETLMMLLFGTSLIFVYLYKFNNPAFFVQLYLLTMALKFLAYGTYNFFMIKVDGDGAMHNVVWFMVLYFSFSGVEVAFLYRKITTDKL